MDEEKDVCGGCQDEIEWCPKHLVFHHSEHYEGECLESQVKRDTSPYDYMR